MPRKAQKEGKEQRSAKATEKGRRAASNGYAPREFRNGSGDNTRKPFSDEDANGAAVSLAYLFNDRRKYLNGETTRST